MVIRYLLLHKFRWHNDNKFATASVQSNNKLCQEQLRFTNTPNSKTPMPISQGPDYHKKLIRELWNRWFRPNLDDTRLGSISIWKNIARILKRSVHWALQVLAKGKKWNWIQIARLNLRYLSNIPYKLVGMLIYLDVNFWIIS